MEMLSLLTVADDKRPQVEYAGFVIRAGARVVDLVVLYVLAFAAHIFFAILLAIAKVVTGNPLGPGLDELGLTTGWNWYFGMLFGLVAAFGYHAICEGFHGSTLGKLLFGLVALKEDLTPCELQGAVVRALAFHFLDSLVVPAIIVMGRSPEKQRIGDQWGKTVVVKRRSAPSGSLRSGLRFLVVILVGSAFALTATWLNLVRATLEAAA